MHQLELHHPFGTSSLRMVGRPDPVVGKGEVLVRMRGISLNFRDTGIIATGGKAAGQRDASPIVPFSDGCGIVEAIGDDVTRVAVGDRVATLFFRDWMDGPPTPEKASAGIGSLGMPGAGRELAVFDERAVSRVPDYLSDLEASCLPCAALTAWRAMFFDAALKPGDVVVFQGTGGVSIFALQFAKAAGFRTIVTSSSNVKLERARSLGANHLVNYRDSPKWSERVREITDGRGADFILDVGGGETLVQSLKAVRMGGHVAVVGVLSDSGLAVAALSSRSFINTSARVQGLTVGSREMFERMCLALELHEIRPVIGRTYHWSEAARAVDEMVAGQHFGKIVLTF